MISYIERHNQLPGWPNRVARNEGVEDGRKCHD